MDAFQVRLDFTALLKRLNASQQSVQKVLGFADRHAAKGAPDIWDCLLTECAKASTSARVNILFLLDYLFTDYSNHFSQKLNSEFRALCQRDLERLVDSVVPASQWEAVKLNSAVTVQILSVWRLKRIFPVEQIDRIIEMVERRRMEIARRPASERNGESSRSVFSKDDVIRRIEEDRERHKRIRERMWMVVPKTYVDAIPEPPVASTSAAKSDTAAVRAAKKPRLDTKSVTDIPEATEVDLSALDPLDIQFDELWETTSDLNEDDLEAWREEDDERWWGSHKAIMRKKAEKEKERLASRADQEHQRNGTGDQMRRPKLAGATSEASRQDHPSMPPPPFVARPPPARPGPPPPPPPRPPIFAQHEDVQPPSGPSASHYNTSSRRFSGDALAAPPPGPPPGPPPTGPAAFARPRGVPPSTDPRLKRPPPQAPSGPVTWRNGGQW